MKFYIEFFDKIKENLEGYIKTSITVDRVIEVFDEHPAYNFEITNGIAQKLDIKEHLDFENFDYFLCAAREYEDETYEYNGEKLYVPPLFLSDVFNCDPIKPK